MAAFTSDQSIAQARATLGIAASVVAHAWLVRRLDRQGEMYYLVVFGEPHASVAVAAISATSGEVSTSAHLPGTEPHLRVDKQQALELAGLGSNAHADLVWRPCRASRSPLYPLWEARVGGKSVYVDQQRLILQELEAAGPGG
jgi:hypothetical protein